MTTLQPSMTESQFQAAVIELAQLNGWLCAHFRTAKVGDSWQTPVAADGKGFPDLVLVHPKRKRVWFVELKSESGRLSPAQRAWMDALESAGALTGVWRPSDWRYIVAALSNTRTPLDTPKEPTA